MRTWNQIYRYGSSRAETQITSHKFDAPVSQNNSLQHRLNKSLGEQMLKQHLATALIIEAITLH